MPAKKIVELAVIDMFGSTEPIELHTEIKDSTVKKICNLIDFIVPRHP